MYLSAWRGVGLKANETYIDLKVDATWPLPSNFPGTCGRAYSPFERLMLVLAD